MRRWHLVFSVIFITFLGFLLAQDFLALIFWQKYHQPAVTLILVQQDASLAMKLGNYFFGGGTYDLDKAETAYKKATRANPNILWGHYELARIYFIRSDFGRALEEINTELAANPENLRSLYVRGLIYGYQNYPGDLDRAEADFRQFIEWTPREWGGYNDHAWVLSRLGRFEDARDVILDSFNKVASSEANPWLWNALGVAYLNLEEFSSAKEAFLNAKRHAGSLTLDGWREAYPGNKKESATEGLRSFRAAIEENIGRSDHVENQH